jgi:tRNA-dihydrouridine synthase
MRRHYTNYFKGMQDIKPYRTRLVEAPTAEEVHEILDELVHAVEIDSALSAM